MSGIRFFYIGPKDTVNPVFHTIFLLSFLGVIMIIVNQIKTKSEEQELKNYVHQRLGRSKSGAPLLQTPCQNLEELHSS